MERQIVLINMAISTVKHIPGHVQTVGTYGIRRAAKKLAKSAKKIDCQNYSMIIQFFTAVSIM